MTQFAVIRAYEVIGEIVKRLPQTFTDEYLDVNWRKLAGFRDFLAHNYDEIIIDFKTNPQYPEHPVHHE